MFFSVIWCPEPMTLATQTQGHSSRSFVLPLNFVSAPYLLKIFIELWSNVNLSMTVCTAHDSDSQTKGHGHFSRSWDLPLNFLSAQYLLNPLKDSLNFTQMFHSVRLCAEPMMRLPRLKVTLQCHRINP